MIGRTAPSNPWIFRQIEQYRGVVGNPYDQPTEADRYQMIRTYFQMLIEEELPDAVGKMKQFASWFTHGVPGGAGLRKAIYDSKSAVDILTRVEEFFEARLCDAGQAMDQETTGAIAQT
jgi:tRNA-dihydrouridine synthase